MIPSQAWTPSSSEQKLPDRVVALLDLARSIGVDAYYVSKQWNQLTLSPDSIDALLDALSNRNDNWLEVKHDQHKDSTLGSDEWGVSFIDGRCDSLLCIRKPIKSNHSTIQHLCKSIGQAFDDYYMLEKQALAQQLAVEIGRQAQNETLLDTRAPGKSQRNLQSMGNVDLDVNIFANAANYTCQILQAAGCVIFDLTEFRMTHASPNQSRSQGSSSRGGRDNPASNSFEDHDTEKGESYDSVGPLSPLPSSNSSAFTSHSRTISSKGNLTSGGGKSHCSYFPSSTPVRVLGHSGPSLEHFEKLPGDVSKPLLALYLSMTRSSGHNSKAFIESTATREWGLSALAPSHSKTYLCCSVAEADSQPAYFIFAHFDQEQVRFDKTEELFIEQVGAYLIYSSIRSRVIAVDRAQMRFTQRMQHELRTPLHAIIGVNEIAKQNLSGEIDLAEMKYLIDSIGTSADSLNLLVDDIVDFSLMERLGGERKLLEVERPLSDWETVCGVITSTCTRAFTLMQRISRMDSNQIGKIPPPELIVVLRDLNAFDFKAFKAQVDLEVIRRIVWKLVMNAVQATEVGLITVTISRKSPNDTEEEGSSTERLEIEVEDTGCGMENKFVEEKLFQPFGKEDEESSGMGLSLSVCQLLAAQLSGRIRAQSELGKGTKMIVSLPLKKANKVPRSVAMRQDGLLVAFLGFATSSKRMFVERFLDQFQCQETNNLETAQIVVLSYDEPEEQMDYQKELELIHSRDESAEVIMMPISILRDLDEERANQLEALELYSGQHGRILDRPMSFKSIQEFTDLIQRIRNRKEWEKGVMMEPRRDLVSSLVSSAPYSTASSSDGTNPRRGSSASDLPNQDHPFVVLVVEDNPLNAKIITTMLKRANIEFLLATNGKEGVDIYKKHLPVLTLLDINMPLMNGFEACEEMRRVQSIYTHKIIAITALSSETEKRRGQECGMDDWLTKPTRMAPLLRDIKRWRREYLGLGDSSPSTPRSIEMTPVPS